MFVSLNFHTFFLGSDCPVQSEPNLRAQEFRTALVARVLRPLPVVVVQIHATQGTERGAKEWVHIVG